MFIPGLQVNLSKRGKTSLQQSSNGLLRPGVSFGLVSVLCQRMLAIFEILSKVKTTFIKRLHLLEEHSQRWRLLLTLSLGENALIMQAPK